MTSKKGVIHVQRQILRQNGAVVEAPLKTKNSYRNIAIGTDTVELLWQIKQQSTSEYVFPSPTGGPISPDSVLHMLQRVLKRAGLKKSPSTAFVIRSQSWPSRTAWTSKRYPPCWATTPQGSPWTLTPTLPPPCKPKPPTPSVASSPVLSSSFWTFPHMGQDMGQKKQAKVKTHKKYKKAKPRRNQLISPEFWHAVRDSNPRPSGP